MVVLGKCGGSGVFVFQYSLCRVVLMVEYSQATHGTQPAFQYSLCRVVLMVYEEVRL